MLILSIFPYYCANLILKKLVLRLLSIVLLVNSLIVQVEVE